MTPGHDDDRPDPSATDLRELYLHLLKSSLTGTLHAQRSTWRPIGPSPARTRRAVQGILGLRGLELGREISEGAVGEGEAFPEVGETLAGRRRLDHLQECVETVVRDRIPGDLIEAGVWRGGVGIFLRGLLHTLADARRKVWLADSFAGLPPPDPRYPADRGDLHHTRADLAVGRAEVEAAFRRYGLLDDRVRFVEGLFEDTLPGLAGEVWAVVRIDADMYGSTWQALEHLYPGLSPGGFVVVDDYGSVAGCRRAVDDFRDGLEAVAPLEPIDSRAVWWRKAERPAGRQY